MKSGVIYLIGMLIFALLYNFLQTRLNDYVFLAIAVIYAFCLNRIAHKFGKDKDSDDT